jgi:SAM-dependent methyltransferase
MESTLDQLEIKSRYLSKSLVFNNPFTRIVDLGMHPFADTFISKNQLEYAEPVFPLSCGLDEKSGLIFNEYLTPDSSRYNLYDYSYTSSNSDFSRKHWIEFAAYTSTVLNKSSRIMEVGSNDGFLSLKLKDLGFEILGVDSSGAMAKIANELGVETVEATFSHKIANDLQSTRGLFDCLIANNVLNHANDPLDFLQGVDQILAPDGVFIFEVPYWLDLFESGHFDQIYHEHVSYFTVKSIRSLLEPINFKIVKISHVDYHGGSLRVIAARTTNTSKNEDASVRSMIESEVALGLFRAETYEQFRKRISIERARVMTAIYDHVTRIPEIPIIGVGAAAKANTLLNFYGLDSSLLFAVTDSSPFKQGKYTPLTRIPIVSDDVFREFSEVTALILSWNLSDKLKHTLLGLNPKIRFLR